MDRQPLASRAEVAEYLGVPAATLRQWAYLGTGPKYSKIGKYARYRWSDVEHWVAERESSTSQGVA